MVRFAPIFCLTAMAFCTTVADAGWPFHTSDGYLWGSSEYYAARSMQPPGQRQHYKFGKVWPPVARPGGPGQPLIHKYHSAHYWPNPYNCQDRESVRQVIDTQTYNGWAMATTLYDYHFDPVTQELNDSGRMHLQWIMTQAPHEFREAHVSVAERPDLNSLRLTNVEREVARMAIGGEAIPVVSRYASPYGRPASEVQTIFQAAAEAMPEPVIPYAGPDNGGDSGG